LIPCLGIVAAIAIPSLLRARISANEASAIGDLRAFSVSQMTYAGLSGGAAATPACLARPADCLPAGTSAPSELLPAERLPGSRHGYRFEFHPGTAVASGLAGYAYTAEPLVQNSTGRRSFCVDGTQPVCWVVRPAAATAWRLEGACPRNCQPL
jgi:type II secretory pathway pseudopilin PulG